MEIWRFEKWIALSEKKPPLRMPMFLWSYFISKSIWWWSNLDSEKSQSRWEQSTNWTFPLLRMYCCPSLDWEKSGTRSALKLLYGWVWVPLFTFVTFSFLEHNCHFVITFFVHYLHYTIMISIEPIWIRTWQYKWITRLKGHSIS